MLNIFTIWLSSALLLTFFPYSAFAQSEKKTAYCVLLDNTRSLEKQFPQVLMLGRGVVKQTQKRGPVSLFAFTHKRDPNVFVMQHVADVKEGGNQDLAVATLGVEWSQDDNALGGYVEALTVVKGHTALYEAVRSMAGVLNAKTSAEEVTFAGKVMILITDGEHRMQDSYGGSVAQDDERKRQRNQLIKELKASGIRVYAVGLTRELRVDALTGMSTRDKAETFLKKVTQETGGRVIFPKSKNIDVNAVLAELLAQ